MNQDYVSAEHDRMLAALIMPCEVVALDLAAARVRVRSGDWTSAWVRWHSQAAGGERYAPLTFKGVKKVRFQQFQNSGAGAASLAALWGARRIILLGYDCQKTGGRAHWHGDHPAALGNAGSVDKWPAQFRQLAAHLAGLEVINCSRETALAAFPRRPLEEVLS